MPITIISADAETPLRILGLGVSGSGKTGSVACLARNRKVAVLSLDSNLSNLHHIVRHDGTQDNISIISISQAYKVAMKRLIPDNKGSGWQDLNESIKDAWPDQKPGFEGSPTNWTTDHVLVIDQLTDLTHLADIYVREITGKFSQAMTYPDWKVEHDQIFSVIKHLVSLPCHVILFAHIAFSEESSVSGALKGFPATLGDKLGRKIPGLFGATFAYQISGTGAKTKRTFSIAPTTIVDAKLGLPQSVFGETTEFPVEDGLAKVFAVLAKTSTT